MEAGAITPALQARQLLRSHRYGVLGSLSKKFDGHPYASLTPYCTAQDGSVLILVSGLADHTRNMLQDPRVSLISHDQRDPDIQTQSRVTLLGEAHPEPDRERLGARYQRHFPESGQLLAMQDFRFFRIRPKAIRLISGFGRAHWIDMADYAVPDAAHLAEVESEVIDRVNADQLARLTRRVGTLHGIPPHPVRLAGLDCDGVALADERQTWRLPFDTPAVDAAALRQAWASLLDGSAT